MPGRSPALLGVLTLRQPGSGPLLALYAFVIGGWAVAALVPGGGPDPVKAVIQIPLTAFLLVAAVLQLRARVRADIEGITARDELGWRRRVAWSDVVRFEFRGNRLGARTVDGGWVLLMRFRGYRRYALQYAEDLETFRRRREQVLGSP